MQYTQEQLEEFKRQFSARRKRQIIVGVSVVVLAVGFRAFGEQIQKSGVPDVAWITGAFVLILAAIVFSFRNWRCPACDRYLGRSIGPSFCPKCGVALQ